MNALELFVRVAVGIDDTSSSKALPPSGECDTLGANRDVHVVGARRSLLVRDAVEQLVQRSPLNVRQLAFAGVQARHMLLGDDRDGLNLAVVIDIAGLSHFKQELSNHTLR